jgi:hypothetical protein
MPEIPLPLKVIVSLRAGVILALANIVCVTIFVYAWTRVRSEPHVISVTGSARKGITSDLVVWSAKVSTIEADLQKAYDTLKASTDKTLEYLRQAGVSEGQVQVSSIGTWKRREKTDKGVETEKVVAYELWQTVQVTSGDVDRIGRIANDITSLIKQGVSIESNPPTYIYTRLADLKITMLAEATRDAQTRAQQIAANSGSSLGSIVDARMGVMQVNPVHVYEATSDGRNDTSSLHKEITAVVSARFALRR